MGFKGHRIPILFYPMFVAAFFLTGGCGSSGSNSADGENIFAAEPNPVKVTVRTDDNRAVSKDINTDGGTVTANAADGTKFTLSLAKGSLLSEETITLIPVSSIDGLPLSGGLSAAVQLQPDGLLLLAPATLTIEPATPVPPEELTAFGYRGEGDGLYLTRYEQGPSRISLDVTHFSGNGIGRGSNADREAQYQRRPRSKRDQLSQDMAKINQGVLDSVRAVKEKDIEEQKREAHRQQSYNLHNYFLYVLMPDLKNINSTDDLFRVAEDVEIWKDDAEKSDDSFNDDMNYCRDKLKEALRKAIDREFERCPSYESLKNLQALDWVAKLVGDPALQQEVVDKWGKCGTIKVGFRSKAQSGGGGASWIYQVSGELELKASVEGESVKFTGSGPLAYDDFRMAANDTGCTAITGTHGSTISASADFNANIREGRQPPPRMALSINPGGPSEDYALECPRVGRINAISGAHAWQEIFMANNPGSLKLDDLDFESGAPVEKVFKGKTMPFGDNQASADVNVTVSIT